MNSDYYIDIVAAGRTLGTVELPPGADVQQADATAREFSSRFRERDGYSFVVQVLQKQAAGGAGS
jgi:hypothetical protein